ncbi:MAG: hypothetical protein IIC49_01365 [Planctomycetes bacterium]|nr:hypothetical protein [Planctomycetota bacterium]
MHLPLEPIEGPISFQAAKVTTWNEAANGIETIRLLLEGSVVARLGLYTLTAERANVWLEKRPAGTSDRPTYQLFVYFDRVSTPDADYTLGVWADRLPVEGVIRPEQGVLLAYDLLEQGRPDDAFVDEGERTLAAYLRSLLSPGSFVAGQGPTQYQPDEPTQPTIGPHPSELASLYAQLPHAPRAQPVFAETGIFAFAPGDAPAYLAGEDESMVILTGGVSIQYWQRPRPGRREQMLQLKAERAVIFLAPGTSPALSRIGAGEIRGIYLEGNVWAESTLGRTGPIVGVNDERYSVRAPKMYYDVQHNRALMLDAVFWTYDRRLRLPLYVRAAAIRQESASQYSAQRARLTNTAFFSPHLSIGARSVTITSTREPGQEDSLLVDARHITLEAEGFPIAYFPRFRGDPTKIPIRDIRLEDSSGSGTTLKLTWDMLSMFGLPRPAGFGLELLTDFYFERGFGGGVSMSIDGPEHEGELLLYGLPNDTGTDVLVTGDEISHDGEARGVFLGWYRRQLDKLWTLRLAVASFSDPTFAGVFDRPLARTGREATNQIELIRTKGNSLLSLTANSALNDFTPNEFLQQSQGYTIDRLPEIKYLRVADDVFAKTAPGLVSYSSETSMGRLRMRFNRPDAREMGFSRIRDSMPAFGIAPDESIAERLRREGLTGVNVLRFDSRHELSADLSAGPVNITPFAVGRFTAWDNDFDDLSPAEDDNIRLWGAIGSHLGTTIQHVDNTIESRMFDLHRIRHIVEPGLTFWIAGTTIDRVNLPVYDENVESIAEGTAWRIGIDQTWQTQRGGPGRWRSVDVFRLKTDLVLASGDVDQESPIGRFFSDRPELSNLGNYAVVDGSWQVTDATALIGSTVYDFDISQPATTVVGGLVRHTPDFSTSGELRYVNAEDATFIDFGARYRLTRTYDFAFRSVYDTDQRKFQRVGGDVTRVFPNVSIGFGVAYNDIIQETSFSFSISPLGVRGRGARLRGLGSSNERFRRTDVGG